MVDGPVGESMTSIFFAWRPEHLKCAPKDSKTISLTSEIPKSAASISDYVSFSDRKKINETALMYLKTWATKKIKDDKTIKELLSFEDVSYWWFIDFWLFYHEMHTGTIKDVLTNIEIVSRIIAKEDPKLISFVDEDDDCGHIISLVAQHKNIPIQKRRTSGFRRGQASMMNRVPFLVEQLKDVKLRFRHMKSRVLLPKPTPKEKVVLSTFTSLWQERVDPITKQVKKSDIMISAIQDSIQKEGIKSISIDIDYTKSLGLRSMLERKNLGRPFAYYVDSASRKAQKKAAHRFRRTYSMIQEQLELSLTYNGISLWPIIGKKFEFAITKRIPEAYMFVMTWKKILKVEHATSVLALDETGLYGRSIVVAAKQLGIRVISMQHGLVGEGSFEYTHLTSEVTGDWKSPHCPIPDITTIYGVETKEFLMRRGRYPKKSLRVTGQPRYDELVLAAKRFSKPAIKKQLGIPFNSKIIMLATQPIPGNMLLVTEVAKAVAKMKNVTLLIKLHPREETEKQCVAIAKSIGTQVKVMKDSLYECLAIADVLITKNSAVALEAMLLNKPVVTVNLTGLPDIVDYEKTEATIQVNKADSLAPIIKTLLDGTLDESHKRKLNRARDAFVLRYTYRADGKATFRVRDVLLGRKALRLPNSGKFGAKNL